MKKKAVTAGIEIALKTVVEMRSNVKMDTATRVYCHITCGRVSKVNTTADAIIGVYEDEITEIEDRRTYCCPICFGSE